MKLKTRLLVIASGMLYIIMYSFAIARIYDPYAPALVTGMYLSGISAVLLTLKFLNTEEL